MGVWRCEVCDVVKVCEVCKVCEGVKYEGTGCMVV